MYRTSAHDSSAGAYQGTSLQHARTRCGRVHGPYALHELWLALEWTAAARGGWQVGWELPYVRAHRTGNLSTNSSARIMIYRDSMVFYRDRRQCKFTCPPVTCYTLPPCTKRPCNAGPAVNCFENVAKISSSSSFDGVEGCDRLSCKYVCIYTYPRNVPIPVPTVSMVLITL